MNQTKTHKKASWSHSPTPTGSPASCIKNHIWSQLWTFPHLVFERIAPRAFVLSVRNLACVFLRPWRWKVAQGIFLGFTMGQGRGHEMWRVFMKIWRAVTLQKILQSSPNLWYIMPVWPSTNFHNNIWWFSERHLVAIQICHFYKMTSSSDNIDHTGLKTQWNYWKQLW